LISKLQQYSNKGWTFESNKNDVWIPKEVFQCRHPCEVNVTRYRELPDQNFNWCHSVYSIIEELLPKDAPKPLGKAVTMNT
jgi:hypothetical protein